MAVSLASSIFSSGRRPKLISEIPTTEKFTHSWQDMQRFRGTRQKLDKFNYDKFFLRPEDMIAVTEEEFGLGFECFGSGPNRCLILSVPSLLLLP